MVLHVSPCSLLLVVSLFVLIQVCVWAQPSVATETSPTGCLSQNRDRGVTGECSSKDKETEGDGLLSETEEFEGDRLLNETEEFEDGDEDWDDDAPASGEFEDSSPPSSGGDHVIGGHAPDPFNLASVLAPLLSNLQGNKDLNKDTQAKPAHLELIMNLLPIIMQGLLPHSTGSGSMFGNLMASMASGGLPRMPPTANVCPRPTWYTVLQATATNKDKYEEPKEMPPPNTGSCYRQANSYGV